VAVIYQKHCCKVQLSGDIEMFNFHFRALALSSVFMVLSTAHAANLSLSPVPLYLGGAVEPNIMFTMDDSGSMHWENMPDDGWTYFIYPRASNVYGTSNYSNYLPVFSDISYSVRIRSSSINSVYYNPTITYQPWSTSTGVSMGDISITCAPHNPTDTAKGCRNLTASNTQTANWETYNGDGTTFPGAVTTESDVSKTFWPAVYYTYNGGDTWTVANFTKVEIRSTTATYTTNVSRSDCVTAPICTYVEEIQNFANWYSYYRSRILAARGGIGRAFGRQSTNMRVGYATINKGNSTIDGVNTDSIVKGVRTFDNTDRGSFFDLLYDRDIPTSGTPLRTAIEDAGKYFERTDDKGPWSETPGTTNTADHLSCRQSYNITMTDGYWNGASPSVNNSDNTDGTTISGPNDDDYNYTAISPYSDAWSNTLADVGMHYWKRDLRTDLDNEVPTNAQDPAFWQHMVNFTVGLGVNGTLDTTADLPGLTAGTTAWPDPSASNGAKIDDMWHTAINSKGEFFSASDPDTFADSLSDILSAISDRTSSASSVALNSGTVSGSSKVYQARFDSGDWSGQLFAYPVNADGTLGSLLWDAASLIPTASSRIIVTYDGADGQPFEWTDISSSQQTLLGSESILDYLRGDQSNEAVNGGTFRNRNTLLGDIIHSSPTYVGTPSLQYPDGLGTSDVTKQYSDFRTTYNARQHLVYVNANDGMLHAFNADTGVEAFAYVPNTIMHKLSDLADINYNHKYYTDASPTVLDAFFGGDWHTVLISGLRSGGQGIFALDVTNPTTFSSQSAAKDNVLWEFTDSDDPDLGYTFGIPSVVKLQNGKWAAVFSGGYNNTFDDDNDSSTTDDSVTGNAVLFIVDIEDGSLIKKFDTHVGSAQDPTGNNKPNGLSTPSVVDIDGDFTADTIYAGDLFGNVWKFDISDPNIANWKTSYGTVASPIPLYTACAASTCNSTNHQPITTQMQVIRHPSSGGYLVLFGTGQYIEVGDNSTTGQITQTYYAIWDKDQGSFTAFNRSNLLQQQILQELSAFSFDLRVTSDNAISWYDGSSGHRGWYIDLVNTEGGNTNNFGERQVSNSIVRNGRIIFTTLLPSDDPCDFGGSGWLMELDLYSGARLSFTPFDLDNDGLFSTTDYVNIGDIDGDGVDDYVPVSGKKSKVGIIPTPSITSEAGGAKEFKFTSGSTGTIEVTVENPGPSYQGRQSWRQLDFN